MEDRYLFKAKRLNNGEWATWDIFSGLFGVDIDKYTICQCTGLKDKHGNLIWENDIMVAHLDDDYPEDETYIRILWNGSGFRTKEKGSEDTLPIDKFDQEHFEVCGNIFDNPELLGRNDE